MTARAGKEKRRICVTARAGKEKRRICVTARAAKDGGRVRREKRDGPGVTGRQRQGMERMERQ